MEKKRAFITGIAGQDGSYLAEYLVEQGYEVFGIVRRNSIPEHQHNRIDHLPDIKFEYGDVLDIHSLERMVRLAKPHEIYNLAAQSHVRISFDVPQFTAQTNALGVLNMLEVYRTFAPDAKFYQASSSEMFGNSIDEDGYQRETTIMSPVSPYGCAKVFGYNIVRNYRKSYNLFACNGILFNHESPRRGSNFVTSKVVKGAVEISKGLKDKLYLGNMDSCRDWGHSKDYVRAMHAILNHNQPDDFVVATGETRSIRDLCSYVFSKLNLKYEDYIEIDPRFLRPQELKVLKGDSSKIRNTLKWAPEYSFETLMDEIIEHWQKVLS